MATEYSGKYGQVDIGASVLATANNWQHTHEVDVDSHGQFGGGGAKVSVAGNEICRGTVSGNQDFGAGLMLSDILKAGDEVVLKLYETTTASGAAAAKFWTYSAVVQSTSNTVDGDTGPSVGWSFSFVSTGAITKPG